MLLKVVHDGVLFRLHYLRLKQLVNVGELQLEWHANKIQNTIHKQELLGVAIERRASDYKSVQVELAR